MHSSAVDQLSDTGARSLGKAPVIAAVLEHAVPTLPAPAGRGLACARHHPVVATPRYSTTRQTLVYNRPAGVRRRSVSQTVRAARHWQR